MVSLLGIIIVLVSVLGGFAMENGKFEPLVQPAEVFIICGSAIGILVVANPVHLIRDTLRRVRSIFLPPRVTRDYYVSNLVLLRALFEYARRNGSTKLEDQIDRPENSPIFQHHAKVASDPAVVAFICDTLRLITMTHINPFDLEELLEKETQAREEELAAPGDALASLADALPGLGIISAVLGVIVTMGSLMASPKVIGQKVGMALVGTFLGIFLSYCLVGPIATHLGQLQRAEADYYRVLRVSLAAYCRGMPTVIALEFGRRSIPPALRPNFVEMEAEFRKASRPFGRVTKMS